jgi:hypothetical protein
MDAPRWASRVISLSRRDGLGLLDGTLGHFGLWVRTRTAGPRIERGKVVRRRCATGLVAGKA